LLKKLKKIEKKGDRGDAECKFKFGGQFFEIGFSDRSAPRALPPPLGEMK